MSKNNNTGAARPATGERDPSDACRGGERGARNPWRGTHRATPSDAGIALTGALALCMLAGCIAGEGEGSKRSAAGAEPPAVIETATTPAKKAEVAESKAEMLEAKAATESGGGPVSPREAITPGEAQAVDPKGKEALDDAITCLARSIYWEAKGEEVVSMEAVASVVMNRLGQPSFPDTVCGVVKQGQERGACQFSWWCDGRPDSVQEAGRYAVAKEVARKALNRELVDRTQGATYFHHKRVAPSWSKTFTRTAQIGAHRYYKPAETAGR